MGKHVPSVEHRMLDRCEICGRLYHRYEMSIQPQDVLRLAGQNRLLYSSYNTAFWTCDAVDGGLTSQGTGEKLRLIPPAHGTSAVATVGYGVQTWGGNGTMRSIVATVLTNYVGLCFSAFVGPKQDSVDPAMTVVLGLCDSDGANKEPLRSWSIRGARRVWVSEDVADITHSAAAVYFYIQVTNTDEWWIDEMQLELATPLTGAFTDVSRPGQFKETAGSVVLTGADTRTQETRKVCPEHVFPQFVESPGAVTPERIDLWEIERRETPTWER